jgi:hypothetical protein
MSWSTSVGCLLQPLPGGVGPGRGDKPAEDRGIQVLRIPRDAVARRIGGDHLVGRTGRGQGAAQPPDGIV